MLETEKFHIFAKKKKKTQTKTTDHLLTYCLVHQQESNCQQYW